MNVKKLLFGISFLVIVAIFLYFISPVNYEFKNAKQDLTEVMFDIAKTQIQVEKQLMSNSSVDTSTQETSKYIDRLEVSQSGEIKVEALSGKFIGKFIPTRSGASIQWTCDGSPSDLFNNKVDSVIGNCGMKYIKQIQ